MIEIGRKYVVYIMCNGKMLRDGSSSIFHSFGEAMVRAKKCADEGERAEVRSHVTMEHIVATIEPN